VIRSVAAAAIGLPFVPAVAACSSGSGTGTAYSTAGSGSAPSTSAAASSAGGASSAGSSSSSLAASSSGGATSAAASTSSSAAPPSLTKINALTSFEDDPAFTPDSMALSLMKSDHGIDVNQATLVGANTAITALIAGQVDIIVSSLVAGVAAAEQGQDITAVFPGVMVPEHVIITNDKIKTWDDVPGKTFGATSKTDSSYWELKLLAQKHGVDIDKVNIVTVKGSSARAAALVAGKIDGAAISVGAALKLLTQNKQLHQFALPGQEFPNLLFDCYFVHNSFLDDHGDVVQAYAESLQKAHRAMYQKQTYLEQAKALVKDAFTDEELDTAYSLLMQIKAWDPTESRWNAEAGNFTTDQLASLGILPDKIDFSKWATTTYVDAARKALGPFTQ
jgi:NitT/TauT family transport system substrate-binding protein